MSSFSTFTRRAARLALATIVGATTVVAVLAPSAPPAAAGPVHQYQPDEPGLFMPSPWGNLTFDDSGTSLGWGASRFNDPIDPAPDGRRYHFAVADQDVLGGTRDLQTLDVPGTFNWIDGVAWGRLSGDGRTFVGQYMAEPDSLGACSQDPMDPTFGSQYWKSQVLVWQRSTPTGTFGDPDLVSSALSGSGCDGVPADDGPDLMGVGGSRDSYGGSPSQDGTIISFESRALDLVASPPTLPTQDDSALYVAEDDGLGGWDITMVTPANMDGTTAGSMLSGDGDSIVFVSNATNLVTGPTIPSGSWQTYLATRTLSGWDIEIISLDDDGDPMEPNVYAETVSIDHAGERVAFMTDDDDFDPTVDIPGADPYDLNVVLHDVASGVNQALVTGAEPVGGLLRGQDLMEHAAVAISWDGNRVGVYASMDDWGRGAVMAYDADDAFSTDPADRRDAGLGRTPIRADIANPYTFALGGSGPYIAATASEELTTDPTDQDVSINIFTIGGGAVDPAKGWHGDPVDTASGSFRHDEVDLPAPSGAGPAGLERTYTSVGRPDGIFGRGWESNLDTRLAIADDAVTLSEPGGTTHDYGLGSGGWEPLDGQPAVLEEISGGWTVTDGGGGVREFDADGRLVAVRRPGEPEVEIAWSGTVPTTMTSADAGYQVTFDDTDLDGLVDQATTSDGRQVDYGYQAPGTAETRLETATRPHAPGQAPGTYGVRTYALDGDLMTSITDEVDGTRTKVVVENTYDEQGRVVLQVTETGDVLEFAYAREPDGMGNPVPATGFTTVTNQASGDVTVYQHNARGEVIGITDAEGGSAGFTWEDGRPGIRESRSGVVTDHTYDAAGRVVEVTQTAGPDTRTIEAVTYVTPDSSPAALTDDRVATRTDEAGVTTTFTYAGASRRPATVSVPCDPASTDPATPCPPSGLSTTTYTYHSGPLAGLLASVTDADGVLTEYGYDSDRSLATTTMYDGLTPLVTSHDVIRAGDVGWSETDPAAVEVRTTETPGGAVTEEVYDAEGHLLAVRDPLFDGVTHLATTYAYGLDGHRVAMTDPAGQVTTYAVARAGDPGWAEAPDIAEVQVETGPEGVSLITKVDRSGNVVVEQKGDPGVPSELATTTHTYGPLGRRLTTTDPTGVTTTFEYDVEGRPVAVVDEDDERTETDYDGFGRVTVETDPLGQTTTTTYDADGRVAAIEDREGHDTTFTYDTAGRLHTTTDARGGVIEQTYTPAGRVATETDATNRTTTYTYDTAGRRTAVELHSGATTTFDHDLDGRVTTVTSPEGRVTTATYDALGRRLTVAEPTSGTTTTTYDAAGRVGTRTDATGGEVAYTYDGERVVTVTDPLGRVTTYGYDSRGNRVSRTDHTTGVEDWEYDLADRLTEEVDQLDRETTLTYDDLGRLATRTDGAGRTETLAYDAAGQVVSSTWGVGAVTTYTYDDEGRRTSMTSGVGTTTWTYDEVGNLTAVDEVGARDLAWTWDLAGRRVEMTTPSGQRQRDVHDADGRLAGVERWDGSAWVPSVDIDRDLDGLVLARDVAGGMDATWDRDATTGRVDTFTEDLGGTVTTTDLTYDAAGRVATTIDGAGTTTYGYDAAGQLTGADRPGTADDETFAYDELGRRTTSTRGATTTTYAWDAASQLTSRTVGGVAHTYTYDDSGRRLDETWNGGTSSREWGYTARGHLDLVRSTTPSGTDETTRTVRGDGVILSSTSTPAGGSPRTTVYGWDTTRAVAQPVHLEIGGDTVTATYAEGLARLQCSNPSLDCEGPVAHDVLGSAVETADTADVVAADAYTAFGEPGVAILDPEVGFRGEIHTADLVHLRARDYDPASGTFLQTDPLDGVDGTTTVANPYHYADNDPVNRADPTGMQPDDDDDLLVPEAQPSFMHFVFPVDEPHRWLAQIHIAGFIPEAQSNMLPGHTPGPRWFEGDNRDFTPAGSFIDPNRNRFFTRLDFKKGRGFMQVNPTCRTEGSWLPGSQCTSARRIEYGEFDGNNPFSPSYDRNFGVMQRAGDKYRFKWSVVHADQGIGQDLFRPRADGKVTFDFVEDDAFVETTWEGDCFPSLEVMRVVGGRSSVIGRVDDAGAESMIGGVTNLYNFVGLC